MTCFKLAQILNSQNFYWSEEKKIPNQEELKSLESDDKKIKKKTSNKLFEVFSLRLFL